MWHTEFRLSFRLLNVRNVALCPQILRTAKILVREFQEGASFVKNKEPGLGEGLIQFCCIKTKLKNVNYKLGLEVELKLEEQRRKGKTSTCKTNPYIIVDFCVCKYRYLWVRAVNW